jgi:hypothetical protein
LVAGAPLGRVCPGSGLATDWPYSQAAVYLMAPPPATVADPPARQPALPPTGAAHELLYVLQEAAHNGLL